MSEFMSGRERRLSPRFNVSLECTITLPDEGQSSRLLFPDAKIEGQTRDVSATGLGLVVPSIYVGYDCIVDEGRILIASLALASGVVVMRATSVHYVRQDAGDEATYLIGLRITEMSDDDRERYHEFLQKFSGSQT